MSHIATENERAAAAPNRRSWQARALSAAGVVWVSLVLVGSYAGLRHDYAVAPNSNQPVPHWPDDVRVLQRSGGPTLLMAIHPSCPCSRASFDQLEQLLNRGRTSVQVVVLFFDAPGLTPGVQESVVWKRASERTDLVSLVDPDGQLASRFGLEISGQTALYNAAGECVFHGGLTAARGQSEAGLGVEFIRSYLAGASSSSNSAPTFGCPIHLAGK